MDATQSHKLNIPILNRQLAYEAWYNTFFSKLAGFMTYTETNGIKSHNPAPNVVVQIMKDFIAEGRDNMIMPMILGLTEPGVYGDNQLKGTGEDLSLNYLQIYINQWRKAATKLTGKMANQRLSTLQLTEKAKPELIKWWAKNYNQACFQALYEGASNNLTIGTNDEGLGLSVRYHPNWYYAANSGALTTLGTAKYTKKASDITSLTTSAVYAMNYKTLLTLVELLTTELLIEPIITEDGNPFWLLLVHPRTWRLLKQDSVIQAAQNSAFNAQMMKHPALSGKQMMYYEGFCIIPEPIGIRCLDSAASDGVSQFANGDVRKGWLSPSLSTYEIENNILLGANALGKGIASSLAFTEEVDDHGNTIEIGSNTIVGFNRADYFSETDSGSTAAFTKNNATKTVLASAYACKNQSSAIISSYVGQAQS